MRVLVRIMSPALAPLVAESSAENPYQLLAIRSDVDLPEADTTLASPDTDETLLHKNGLQPLKHVVVASELALRIADNYRHATAFSEDAIARGERVVLQHPRER